jgi:hypothetical protein
VTDANTNGVTTEAKREQVRARLAEIAREKEARRMALRDLADELTVRFSEEIGEVEVDWTLVTNEQLGVLCAVQRGPVPRFRTFLDGRKNRADAWDLVKPNLLYPDLDGFKALAEKHDEVPGQCALAICEMHGVRTERQRGK